MLTNRNRQRPGTSINLINRKLKNQSISTFGQTDMSLYQNVFAGYRNKGQKNCLSIDQLNQIESVLPCPHNPNTLSHLYLEGKSKLQLEANVAMKSSHLVVLNQSDSFSQGVSDPQLVNPLTCLVEKDHMEVYNNMDAQRTRPATAA